MGSPMKILVYSDLHTEFGPFSPPDVQADVVVLAGDTHVGIKGVDWAQAAFPDVPVIFVLGNHEFYKKPYPNIITKLKAAASGSNVHVLERDRVEIDGVSFLGCTLWASFNLFGDRFVAGVSSVDVMTDFKKIRVAPDYRRMRPSDMSKWHGASVSWLVKELDSSQSTECVVVTHHAPSPQSLAADWADDVVNAAYASDLEQLIRQYGPALWIHGHIHRPSDYMVGKTRVVCNPRGYVDEPVVGFNPLFCVELERG